MSGKNTYLNISDFTDRGFFNSSGLECTIDNVFFRKGDTLEHHQIKQVLDTCKQYNASNINTLIVKEQKTLTIWIADKSSSNQSQSAELKDREQDIVSSPKLEGDRALPTKTITKRYRGQIYEETVIDWSAVQQMSQPNKPRRKYRGQYID